MIQHSEISKAEILSVRAQNLLDDIRSKELKKIYIAGPMSGYDNFNRDKFNHFAGELETKGYVVLNPATLPGGLTQAEYMDICCAMIRSATSLLMLDDWAKSDGAVAEHYLAKKLGKTIYLESHFNDLTAVA
jgi:hypothetical protein